MAADDYNDNHSHQLQRDVRDAHVNSSTAKTLATLALIISAVALALSVMAWNKANDAWGNAQRALNVSQNQ